MGCLGARPRHTCGSHAYCHCLTVLTLSCAAAAGFEDLKASALLKCYPNLQLAFVPLSSCAHMCHLPDLSNAL